MTTQLDAALTYYSLGWSIIQIPHGQTKAAIKWKPFQTRRPGKAQLRASFGNGRPRNMGVVHGSVKLDPRWITRNVRKQPKERPEIPWDRAVAEVALMKLGGTGPGSKE
jgi:hypothetical protein